MTSARDAYGPYGVVIRRTAHAAPEAFRFRDPADALLTALDYLRRHHWVRLTDPTIDALADGTRPELADLRAKLARTPAP